MIISAGRTVLLTGATGGLGTVITAVLAKRKLKLALVAYPGVGLEELARSAESAGSKVFYTAMDLRDPDQRRDLLRQVRKELGPVDILINNAGVEFTSRYHDLTEKQLSEVLSVNLEAPMLLTRLLLPEMLERQQGHIVNMSSLAGKSGPAFQEPYAATKAGLIGFTASLRASYRGSGVSASVIVPAFVEAGIYERLKKRTGCSAPAMLTGCSAEQVAQAVIRAIEKDVPEIIVNRYPLRPVLAISAFSPSVGDWIATRLGVHDFFRRVLDTGKQG